LFIIAYRLGLESVRQATLALRSHADRAILDGEDIDGYDMVAAALHASGPDAARDGDIELGHIERADPGVRREDYQALGASDTLKAESTEDDLSKDKSSHTDLEIEPSLAATSNHGLLSHRSNERVDVFIMSTQLDRMAQEAEEEINAFEGHDGARPVSLVKDAPGTLASTLGSLYGAIADVALFPLRTIGVVGVSSAEETAAGAELMMEAEDIVHRRG
jgi:hypothetical protein